MNFELEPQRDEGIESISYKNKEDIIKLFGFYMLYYMKRENAIGIR